MKKVALVLVAAALSACSAERIPCHSSPSWVETDPGTGRQVAVYACFGKSRFGARNPVQYNAVPIPATPPPDPRDARLKELEDKINSMKATASAMAAPAPAAPVPATPAAAPAPAAAAAAPAPSAPPK